jgi:uncharacterized repeat protein (TIGR03803 family)
MTTSASKRLPLLLFAFALASSLAAAQTFTVLYSFSGGADGGSPTVGLTKDSAGNLYGTSTSGGDLSCRAPIGCGTVFKLDVSGNLSVAKNLHHNNVFVSDLTVDAAGNLYGSTSNEGSGQNGDVYKVDQSEFETVLYPFPSENYAPFGGVIRDPGNLYGTTSAGTAYRNGTVFRLSSSGQFVVLHGFSGTDGSWPRGDLVRDSSGTVYGTTWVGGTNNEGTVYKVDLNGTFTSLHSFSQGPDALPLAGVIRDSGGNLYGTTHGSYELTNKCIANGGCGSVFKLDSAGNETILHTFSGGSDGAFPMGALVRDSAGNLYGTTFRGGANDKGAIFEIRAKGQFKVLYSFQGGVDGFRPQGRLIRDSAGNLYGTSEFGGDFQQGCIYRLSP